MISSSLTCDRAQLAAQHCRFRIAAAAHPTLRSLSQGVDLSHEELLEFISESCTMSKALDEYEGRKSCAITTARRLSQASSSVLHRANNWLCPKWLETQAQCQDQLLSPTLFEEVVT